jgi:hypothetical protein
MERRELDELRFALRISKRLQSARAWLEPFDSVARHGSVDRRQSLHVVPRW